MRILILSASVGSGHVRAAEALQEAFRLMAPEVEVEHLDVLQYGNSFFRWFYSKPYLKLANDFPRFLGYLYNYLDSTGYGEVQKKVEGLSLSSLLDYIEKRKPDFIINTHFLPCALVGKYFKIPQATVITDFDVHELWINTNCSYFVASEQTSYALMSRGISQERIYVTGIPVHPSFSVLPLPTISGRTRILQLSGGEGIGPVKEILKNLLLIEEPVEITVVTGRNKRIRKELENMRISTNHPVKILGFVDNMAELMNQSDLVVTKPGGLTSAESLAVGLAIVIVNPIPGQEERNSDYLLETGASIKVNDVRYLPYRIDDLIRTNKIGRMQEMSKMASKPRAAFHIARIVLRRRELFRQ